MNTDWGHIQNGKTKGFMVGDSGGNYKKKRTGKGRKRGGRERKKKRMKS
jgi:hypothetical protein